MATLRKSKQRERILEYLRSNNSHPTAQRIYEDLLPEFPSLSLGTVYRNLNILAEQGQIRKLQYGSTFDRFDAVTGSHYHFVCRRCGRVYDLPLEHDPELEQRAAAETEHQVEDHRVDFFGVCAQCKRNKN
jgi:Fur family peroxide stress response transcriptional regulator